MLQAIHLLLAFELFIVVVGVDARWVRHSLKKQFPDLLSEDPEEADEHPLVRTASPRDYVEKIFQVPFWLKPMSKEASAELLNGLIPDSDILPAITQTVATQRPVQSQKKRAAVIIDARAVSGGAGGAMTPLSGGSAPPIELPLRPSILKKRKLVYPRRWKK